MGFEDVFVMRPYDFGYYFFPTAIFYCTPGATYTLGKPGLD